MPGFETPTQDGPTVPNSPPSKGPVKWLHAELEPAIIGPAALQTARFGAWDALDLITRARHLRALVVMSLQAATLHAEPQELGALSAATYPDEEHNAAGAAVARTVMLIAPRGPALVSQNMLTHQGLPPVMVPSGETGAAPLVVAAIVLAVAAVGAAAYLIGRYTGETADRSDFRENKTRQLVSTQATVIEALTTHATRERLAGKPLPFTDEERRLLDSLEQTQRQIAEERHQPLPSPFDGAKSLADLGRSAAGVLDALLPIAVIGGGLYLLSRFGGAFDSNGRAAEPAAAPASRDPREITLTLNKEGVYEQEEGHG
jgi:hypothetical protein